MARFVRLVKALFAQFGIELRRFHPGTKTGGHSNFGEQAIIERLVKDVAGLKTYCVDIGAGDGAMNSNTIALIETGWSGTAFELDGNRFGRLAWQHHEKKDLGLVRTQVTPLNIVALLTGMSVPKDFGFLSLDIDGYDYFVLEAILKEFTPAILCVEINEKIPPPIRFTVLWREDYAWNQDHFFSQSLSQAHALAVSRGYALVELEYNNAFFVKRDLYHGPELSPEKAYQQGYLSRPDRLVRLPWNRDMEDLQGIPPQAVIEKLHSRFAQYAGKYLLE